MTIRNQILSATLFLVAFTLSVAADTKYLTEHEAMAREIFATVVAMDTSVTEHRTPEMAAYLAKLFREAGFPDEDVMEIPTSADLTSLIVRFKGRDEHKKGIGFLAHMDVVTAFRKDWELDPFTLIEKDDYFIGRGTADNKAGVVGLTTTFIKLKQAGYVPDRNMVLIFTADEETGMTSTHHIANKLSDVIDIEYGINSDALSGILMPNGKLFGYYVQGAEKSYRTVELTVRNPGGHSSAPRPDNAIYQLARALTRIENYKFPVTINSISAEMLSFTASRSNEKVAAAINRLLENPADQEAAELVSRDPMNATTIRTTCVATMLNAGHAENALPQSATATINCRIMPGVEPAEIYKTLAEVVDDSEIEIRSLQEGTIAGASPMRADVMAAIEFAIEDQYPDAALVPLMASYGTDGKEFRAVGIPVYGSSGTFMNPMEAYPHGLNEKLPVGTFYQSLGYWERLMMRLTGGTDN